MEKDFHTRSVMEGFLTSETSVNIQCQFETPHPDTEFQIQVLEIVLQGEERTLEMEEIKTSEKHGKKINFSFQREHLKSMEQLINIISPSTNQYSFLPTGFNGIEIIAFIGVTILLAILGVYISTEGIQISFLGVYNSTGGIQISFLGVYNSTWGIQISFLGFMIPLKGFRYLTRVFIISLYIWIPPVEL